jgi:mono/diheme cytochrome c family protein
MSIIMLMLLLGISCEKKNGTDYNPPADHTISKDGVMHKSGLKEPLDNCISCHGDDLRGGTSGVSCYECHGKEW